VEHRWRDVEAATNALQRARENLQFAQSRFQETQTAYNAAVKVLTDLHREIMDGKPRAQLRQLSQEQARLMVYSVGRGLVPGWQLGDENIVNEIGWEDMSDVTTVYPLHIEGKPDLSLIVVTEGIADLFRYFVSPASGDFFAWAG
jgi:hypothetical protein